MVVTCHPHRHLSSFTVGGKGLLLLADAAVVFIHIAELIQAQVGVLVVDVAGNALQATEEQRLTHHVQVAAEGVHDVNQLLVLRVVVVRRLTQRIVQNFVEAGTHQLLRHQVLQLVLTVFVALDDER